MTRFRKVTNSLKKKILRAYANGATQGQIMRYGDIGEKTIYENTTSVERGQARRRHEATIKGIFG